MIDNFESLVALILKNMDIWDPLKLMFHNFLLKTPAFAGTFNKFRCNEQFESKDLCDSTEEDIEDFEDVTLEESYLDAGEEELDNDISIVCHQAAVPKSYKVDTNVL